MDPAYPSPLPAGAPQDLEVWQFPDGSTWRAQRKFQDRIWLHVVLLLATIVSTTLVGIGHYAFFTEDLNRTARQLFSWPYVLHGLWYAITILAILGSHEMGHYLACRHYDVDATLPFFLPMPLVQSGTLGAVIRIREPIPTKRALFDIGIAGPIAGFVVLVPALIIGLFLSNVTKDLAPEQLNGVVVLGEPLLYKAVSWVFWGIPPDGYSVNLHPMALAAWFGMLVTALNLFPIGQLDGGHISYAVLGRKSSNVTLAMLVCAAILTYFSASWIAWTVLLTVMLFVFGRHHPRTFDEDVPLDRRRKLLALFAIVMFVLCFTPAPISPLQIMR